MLNHNDFTSTGQEITNTKKILDAYDFIHYTLEEFYCLHPLVKSSRRKPSPPSTFGNFLETTSTKIEILLTIQSLIKTRNPQHHGYLRNGKGKAVTNFNPRKYHANKNINRITKFMYHAFKSQQGNIICNLLPAMSSSCSCFSHLLLVLPCFLLYNIILSYPRIPFSHCSLVHYLLV